MLRGDCDERRESDSIYCYYHTKVVLEQLEAESPHVYPVWPLPLVPWTLT